MYQLSYKKHNFANSKNCSTFALDFAFLNNDDTDVTTTMGAVPDHLG